jgi:lysophospholipase L1-like esterase
MRSKLWLVMLAAPLAIVLLVVGCTDDAEPADYVALGDSVAEGIGATDPEATGYVPIFHEHLREVVDGGDELRLTNLARAGETTESFIADGQLAEALETIRDEQTDVRVVTVHLGGNDGAMLFDVCGSGLTPACQTAIPATLAALAQNYDAILGQLRAAAGEDATIVVGTYHNAVVHPGCELSAFASLAGAVLEGDPTLQPDGINDLIRAAAARHGAVVAEVGQLSEAQIVDDCRHTTDAGHDVIASAYAAAFDAS